MAQFFRDEQLANITIDQNAIEQIFATLENRRSTMPEQGNLMQESSASFLFTIIRFDNKGHHVFTLSELLNYFHQAKYVERIIFILESAASVSSNRAVGSYLEVRFDHSAPKTCFLSVASDNNDWVESSFSAVIEALGSFKNRNRWAQSIWTQFIVQVAGVFTGFLISLWVATSISPHLAIENAFIISFLFVLLIFSNLWTYLNQLVLLYVNRVFPSIKFYRQGKDRMHWLSEAIVGGIVVAIVLFLLNIALSYVGRIAGAFIKHGV